VATSGSDVRRVDEGESECGQEYKCQRIGATPARYNQVRNSLKPISDYAVKIEDCELEIRILPSENKMN